jgi:hypothetical protein
VFVGEDLRIPSHRVSNPKWDEGYEEIEWEREERRLGWEQKTRKEKHG